jgi:hypothetical protein
VRDMFARAAVSVPEALTALYRRRKPRRGLSIDREPSSTQDARPHVAANFAQQVHGRTQEIPSTQIGSPAPGTGKNAVAVPREIGLPRPLATRGSPVLRQSSISVPEHPRPSLVHLTRVVTDPTSSFGVQARI